MVQLPCLLADLCVALCQVCASCSWAFYSPPIAATSLQCTPWQLRGEYSPAAALPPQPETWRCWGRQQQHLQLPRQLQGSPPIAATSLQCTPWQLRGEYSPAAALPPQPGTCRCWGRQQQHLQLPRQLQGSPPMAATSLQCTPWQLKGEYSPAAALPPQPGTWRCWGRQQQHLQLPRQLQGSPPMAATSLQCTPWQLRGEYSPAAALPPQPGTWRCWGRQQQHLQLPRQLQGSPPMAATSLQCTPWQLRGEHSPAAALPPQPETWRCWGRQQQHLQLPRQLQGSPPMAATSLQCTPWQLRGEHSPAAALPPQPETWRCWGRQQQHLQLPRQLQGSPPMAATSLQCTPWQLRGEYSPAAALPPQPETWRCWGRQQQHLQLPRQLQGSPPMAATSLQCTPWQLRGEYSPAAALPPQPETWRCWGRQQQHLQLPRQLQGSPPMAATSLQCTPWQLRGEHSPAAALPPQPETWRCWGRQQQHLQLPRQLQGSPPMAATSLQCTPWQLRGEHSPAAALPPQPETWRCWGRQQQHLQLPRQLQGSPPMAATSLQCTPWQLRGEYSPAAALPPQPETWRCWGRQQQHLQLPPQLQGSPPMATEDSTCWRWSFARVMIIVIT